MLNSNSGDRSREYLEKGRKDLTQGIDQICHGVRDR